LLLKPKYEKLWEEMRQEHYRDLAFSEFSDELVLERFLKIHEGVTESKTRQV